MPPETVRDAPERPGPADVGRTYRLESALPCAYCGHVLEVAQIVRLETGAYGFACRNCAPEPFPT